MKMRYPLFVGLVLMSVPTCAQKSERILLQNPSFEDEVRMSKAPQDGKTYINLITRSNETSERIGQTLDKQLESGDTCAFLIYLARAENFLGLTHNGKEKTINVPVVLRIWGGSFPYEKSEILGYTTPVSTTKWECRIYSSTHSSIPIHHFRGI
jgi:hypothetical protein